MLRSNIISYDIIYDVYIYIQVSTYMIASDMACDMIWGPSTPTWRSGRLLIVGSRRHAIYDDVISARCLIFYIVYAMRYIVYVYIVYAMRVRID